MYISCKFCSVLPLENCSPVNPTDPIPNSYPLKKNFMEIGPEIIELCCWHYMHTQTTNFIFTSFAK